MDEFSVGPAEFTRQLLRRSLKPPVALPLRRTPAPGGAPRMQWIGEALRKDSLGWLTRQGGWRARQVVVGERRREGRIWDRQIFPRLGIRFTSGPLHLLVAAMETKGPLPQLDAQTRKRISQGLAGADPATGDLLALHRVVSALEGASHKARPREQAEPRAEERSPKRKPEPQLLRELLALSPLTLVFDPEQAGRLAGAEQGERAVVDVARRLAPLFVGERAVLLSYLDDAIASSWLRAERRRRGMSPQDALESYRATVVGLEGYLRAAKDHPDALRPLIAFFEGYVVHRFGGRVEVHTDLSQQVQGFHRASEREAFMHAAGGLFELGQRVTAAVEAALAAPFVDRTERQKVLLADYHTRFRDIGPEVEAIRRELVGEIG